MPQKIDRIFLSCGHCLLARPRRVRCLASLRSIFNDGLPMLHCMTLDTVMDPILETSGLDQAMPEIKAGNIRNERTQRTQRRR